MCRHVPLSFCKLSHLDKLAFEQRFLMGLQKYLKPGQAIYVPAYKYYDEQEKRRWTPQAVLDSTGTHYFTVVVPENRPVTKIESGNQKAQ